MAGGDFYLGRPGALQKLPPPLPGFEVTDLLRGGLHELAAGGNVRDRTQARRRWVLGWKALTDDEWSGLRTLYRLPGPYRLLDPRDRNRLTVNQSTGTEELRDTTGHRPVTQGVLASDTAFAHSGTRSLKWDSETALAVSSGRGVAYATSGTSIDASWAAVRPSVAHTFSVWAHASIAVSMAARIDWYSTAGALLSSSVGSGTSVSTSAWTQLTVANASSPATAAYGIGGVQNTTTTGAAVQVWLDDPQLEEGAVASTWLLGGGSPLVVVDTLAPSAVLAGFTDAELVLLEL
jgi:hypothetical protein